MEEKIIEAFVKNGAKRWTKGSMDRLYINADVIGYEWDKYKSGNICYAAFKGERISNSEMNRVLCAKAYMDVADGELHTSRCTDSHKQALEYFVEEVLKNA